ncbi:MAG: methyltransferase domain-containing protein [Propionibacteriaceae bacterium]|jgi:SAM-dependent methyltransferase|nr:methyltransferase domain-containing protein [Propionibacteriaceae bacterium]
MADTFPEAALAWMVPVERVKILALGRRSLPMARRLSRLGHQIVLVEPDAPAAAKAAVKAPGIRVISADPVQLPFAAATFGAVLISQAMGAFDREPVMAELARVLEASGELVVHNTVRDDSVPWVRRLAGILQRVDPTAMTASAEHGSERVESKHFAKAVERDFRLWTPMDKATLLQQVGANPRVKELDDAARASMLEEVAALYDSCARAPEPLLLPYKIACWKAEVDHRGYIMPLRRDAGFRISL